MILLSRERLQNSMEDPVTTDTTAVAAIPGLVQRKSAYPSIRSLPRYFVVIGATLLSVHGESTVRAATQQSAAETSSDALPYRGFEHILENCDRIVEARVVKRVYVPRDMQRPDVFRERDSATESIPETEGAIRLIELEVTRTIMGGPASEHMFILDDAYYAYLNQPTAVALGEESLWFLERDPFPWKEDSGSLARMEYAAAPYGIHVVAEEGLGRITLGQNTHGKFALLPSRAYGVPAELVNSAVNDKESAYSRVPYGLLVEWMEGRVQDLVPSVSVARRGHGFEEAASLTLLSNGSVRIGFTAMRGHVAELKSPEHLKVVLASARAVEFQTMPAIVGVSVHPDSPDVVLRIRTKDWVRRVVIESGRPSDARELSQWCAAGILQRLAWDVGQTVELKQR